MAMQTTPRGFGDILRGLTIVQDDDGFDEILGEIFRKAVAGSHKYLRKVPTGNPKHPWRYYYSLSSLGRGVEHGEEVSLGGNKTAKIVAHGEHGLTVQHDDGTKQDLTHDQWHDKMHEAHGDAYTAAVDKRARSWANAVYRHVPREILGDLKGTTDAERLADLRERAPEVYAKLESAFKRAGVTGDAAKGMVAWVLQRRGWSPDARAALLGAGTDMRHGAAVVRSYREVAAVAQTAAGSSGVTSEHVGAALEKKGIRASAGVSERVPAVGKPSDAVEQAQKKLADAEDSLARTDGKQISENTPLQRAVKEARAGLASAQADAAKPESPPASLSEALKQATTSTEAPAPAGQATTLRAPKYFESEEDTDAFKTRVSAALLAVPVGETVAFDVEGRKSPRTPTGLRRLADRTAPSGRVVSEFVNVFADGHTGLVQTVHSIVDEVAGAARPSLTMPSGPTDKPEPKPASLSAALKQATTSTKAEAPVSAAGNKLDAERVKGQATPTPRDADVGGKPMKQDKPDSEQAVEPDHDAKFHARVAQLAADKAAKTEADAAAKLESDRLLTRAVAGGASESQIRFLNSFGHKTTHGPGFALSDPRNLFDIRVAGPQNAEVDTLRRIAAERIRAEMAEGISSKRASLLIDAGKAAQSGNPRVLLAALGLSRADLQSPPANDAAAQAEKVARDARPDTIDADGISNKHSAADKAAILADDAKNGRPVDVPEAQPPAADKAPSGLGAALKAATGQGAESEPSNSTEAGSNPATDARAALAAKAGAKPVQSDEETARRKASYERLKQGHYLPEDKELQRQNGGKISDAPSDPKSKLHRSEGGAVSIIENHEDRTNHASEFVASSATTHEQAARNVGKILAKSDTPARRDLVADALKHAGSPHAADAVIRAALAQNKAEAEPAADPATDARAALAAKAGAKPVQEAETVANRNDRQHQELIGTYSRGLQEGKYKPEYVVDRIAESAKSTGVDEPTARADAEARVQKIMDAKAAPATAKPAPEKQSDLQRYAQRRLKEHDAGLGRASKEHVAAADRKHLEILAKGGAAPTAMNAGAQMLHESEHSAPEGRMQTKHAEIESGARLLHHMEEHDQKSKEFDAEMTAIEKRAGDKPTQGHVFEASDLVQKAEKANTEHHKNMVYNARMRNDGFADDETAHAAVKSLKERLGKLSSTYGEQHETRLHDLQGKLEALGARGQKGAVSSMSSDGERRPDVQGHVHKGLGITKDVENDHRGKQQTGYTLTHNGTGAFIGRSKNKAEVERLRGAMLATGVDWDKHKDVESLKGDQHWKHVAAVGKVSGHKGLEGIGPIHADTITHLESNVDKHLAQGPEPTPPKGGKPKAEPVAKSEPTPAPKVDPTPTNAADTAREALKAKSQEPAKATPAATGPDRPFHELHAPVDAAFEHVKKAHGGIRLSAHPGEMAEQARVYDEAHAKWADAKAKFVQEAEGHTKGSQRGAVRKEGELQDAAIHMYKHEAEPLPASSNARERQLMEQGRSNHTKRLRDAFEGLRSRHQAAVVKEAAKGYLKAHEKEHGSAPEGHTKAERAYLKAKAGGEWEGRAQDAYADALKDESGNYDRPLAQQKFTEFHARMKAQEDAKKG